MKIAYPCWISQNLTRNYYLYPGNFITIGFLDILAFIIFRNWLLMTNGSSFGWSPLVHVPTFNAKSVLFDMILCPCEMVEEPLVKACCLIILFLYRDLSSSLSPSTRSWALDVNMTYISIFHIVHISLVIFFSKSKGFSM